MGWREGGRDREGEGREGRRGGEWRVREMQLRWERGSRGRERERESVRGRGRGRGRGRVERE
jgi:hypothetical protein